jgi:hypothetical protein
LQFNALLLFAVCWTFMLMTTAQAMFAEPLAAGGVSLVVAIQHAIGIDEDTDKATSSLVDSLEWMGPDAASWVLFIGAALLWWKRMIPDDRSLSAPASSAFPHERVKWVGRELPVSQSFHVMKQ